MKLIFYLAYLAFFSLSSSVAAKEIISIESEPAVASVLIWKSYPKKEILGQCETPCKLDVNHDAESLWGYFVLVQKEGFVAQELKTDEGIVENGVRRFRYNLIPLEEATYTSGDTFRDTLSDRTLGPEMVVLPAGKFLMGSPKDEKGRNMSEGPQVEITILKPFAVGKYELTWNEWEACVAKQGCKDNSRKGSSATPDPEWSGDASYGRGTRPVINVSWEDAEAFVKWLSAETSETYRLLSEAEWEYAARAGSTGRFSWGDTEPTCEVEQENTANFNGPHSADFLAGCNGRQTEPVGFSGPNSFGLYDMHGNVREWTKDCYHVYLEGIPTDGTPWVTDCARRGEGNVFRGGSFTGGVNQMRSAARQATHRREINLGFRIARELD